MTLEEVKVKYNLADENFKGIEKFIAYLKEKNGDKEIFLTPSRPSGLNTIFYTRNPLKVVQIIRGYMIGIPDAYPEKILEALSGEEKEQYKDDFDIQMAVLQGRA